eukprot:TRINITY_DN2337_c0_g1_i2.p1 TRINITY_DN2337_c0_g1~~TRINITY_DN2337_c0_g1_i2.p1  ORF type:complete len:1347 (+),score=433.49 TRINITY_DN2337_c0_g1_i2:163-4203(+)
MEEEEEYSNSSSKGTKNKVEEGLVLILLKRATSILTNGRLAFVQVRHHSNANPEPGQKKIAKWRMRERMKTVSVALIYCLNIGVDPPDVVKTDPCARMECWIDPLLLLPQKAAENIGKALQAGYERWQPRARYKLSADPTVDDVKKLCLSLRRNAKDERVLFHYNGHGVPKPTSNGEIWVFNKNFTQYIPLSIYELQTWMGSPSIYVFDCSAAGTIVNWFIQFAEQREKENERGGSGSFNNNSNNMNANNSSVIIKDYILLAACGANELLPMNPELPADVFTSCLTTPIKMALRWFCSNSLIAKQTITFEMIDKIPGRLVDRKTPLGELNWIFTAITDTIAWNTLRREVFQKLFRQDLLVASLFRNFLLSERILRSLNCIPISYPKLPPTYQHPMWEAWDLAVDLCLSQLPAMIEDQTVEYQHSPFFSEQLTAFEVWLKSGSEKKEPPAQLPIVLQVLLSQAHRLRALVLLAKFLDLGSWAVNLALSVGIFPYVLRLLQSLATDLRQVLVFIWAKILALDKSCQLDLVKDNGHNYFINVLSASSTVPSEQRTMSAFILSVISNNCRPGQSACLNGNLLSICVQQLNDPDPLLRRWLILCMAKLWESFEEAKSTAVKAGIHEKLCSLLTDPIPEVRAAVVYALGLFMGGAEGDEERTSIELNLGLTLPIVTEDASPMVRKELIIALSRLIKCYEVQFKEVAAEMFSGEKNSKDIASLKKKVSRIRLSEPTEENEEKHNNNNHETSGGSIYGMLWKVMLSLVGDPFPELSSMAESVVKIIHPASLPDLNAIHQSQGGLFRTNSNQNASRQKAKKQPGLFNSLRISGASIPTSGTASKGSSPPHSQIGNSTPPTPHSIPANLLSGLITPVSNALLSPRSRVSSSDNLSKLETSAEEESSEPVDLQSVFYEWSGEYFSSPLLSPNEMEDPTGPFFSEKLWRQKRNQSVVLESNSIMKQLIRSCMENLEGDQIFGGNSVVNKVHIRLDQVAVADVTEASSSILLHPFEPTIIIADDKDGITVWDREAAQRVSWFRNRSLSAAVNNSSLYSDPIYGISRTTSMSLINDHDISLLLVGSDDGVVRLWSGFDEPAAPLVGNTIGSNPNPFTSSYQANGKLKLTSAWRALPNLVSGTKGAGLVTNWQQEHGLLFASGDAGVVRIWDLERESHIQDMLTGTDACVTSMSSCSTGTRTLVVGCGDGSIRLFDYRSPPKYGPVATYIEHREWVINVHTPKSDSNKIVSGALSGEIKFWDLASTSSTKTVQAYTRNVMSALAVHDYMPIFACGSQNQKIKVYNFNGDELNEIRYHDGFLGQRIGPVSCLSFHSYLMLLAGGATDSLVSLYGTTNSTRNR